MNSLKDKAIAFLQGAATGNVEEVYKTYVAEGFRHHNPYYKGDATSLKEGMKEASAMNPTKSLEVQLAVEEGNHVSVYSHVKPDENHSGYAVVHFFRFKDGRIAELWDVGQAVPEGDEMVNEEGMF
ncbi:nuclear transport factor 2 family protein [Chryseomicrobium palamuruense]|uniref:Nuclear transport factor 2 family protein n=1 Tax=Chryseomicrobium palamuruense TaxID=682973 RepID=A0ABV8UYJ7_9BACL